MNDNVRASLLSLLLLASGFCGISYEVLYGRLLSDLVGSQFLINAGILLTFLVGIGVGTRLAHRFWRHLALVEAFIGLYAVLFAFSLPVLDRLLYSDALPHITSFPLFSCVMLLALPAFCIGISLPVFSGYMAILRSGLVFSKTYAVYNFGAALVVLLIEFYLIRRLGVRFATISIAALNLLVAVILLFLFNDISRKAPEVDRQEVFFSSSIKTALILAGIGSAIFQLFLIKLGECVFGPFRETFALVLCLIFSGIALGSWLVRSFRVGFSMLMLVNLAGLVWLLVGFDWAVNWYARLHPDMAHGFVAGVGLRLAFLIVIGGLPVMTFGATIPAVMTSQQNVARESGRLLFLTSMANGAGFLLMAMLLHRYLDYHVLLMVVAGLSAAALLVYSRFSGWIPGMALLMILLLPVASKTFWNENLLYLGHTSFVSASKMKDQLENMAMPEKFKGPQDVFSIVWRKGRPGFFINGYVSMDLDSPYEPLVGAVSTVFSPRLDNALVLGVGSGNTASVAGMIFDRTDGVEINGTVLENLHRMKEWNNDIENNPKVRLFQDDAIHYVKSGSSRYSLIINTVTTPLYFSSSKLYTLDFFQAVKKRLTPDGVYVTWVDSRVGDEGVQIMLRTLSQAFRHASLAYIKGSYFLLLCSDESVKPRQPQAVSAHQGLANYFRMRFRIDAGHVVYQLLEPDAYRLITERDGRINTVDYPALEFVMTRMRERGYEKFQERIRQSMSAERLADALEPYVKLDPVGLMLHARRLVGDSPFADNWDRIFEKGWEGYRNRYIPAFLAQQSLKAEQQGTADGFHDLGLDLMHAELYREALVAFKKALALNPARNNTSFNIGACYEGLGRFEEALTSYRAEWQVDPDDEEVPFRLGRVYYKMGRYDESLESLKKAEAETPHAEVFRYLGLVYEKMGKRDEALEAFRRVLKLDPTDQETPRDIERMTSQPGRG